MDKNKKARAIIAGAITAAACWYTYFPHAQLMPSVLFINTTASIPRGIYIKIPGTAYKKDDLVVYEPSEQVKSIAVPNGWCKENELFIKKIGAMENESYAINRETLEFTINGRYAGYAVEKTSSGVQLPKLRGEFKVPENEFLPVTLQTRSFDGRYTGTVPLNAIKAKVVPVLIELSGL